MSRIRRPVSERVIEKTVAEGDCWVFRGKRTSSGYGMTSMWVGDDLRAVCAHRALYIEMVGPIPDEMELDHLCRNRACVRPDHLEPVTHRENQRRSVESRPTCKRGHLYTDASAYWTRGGNRVCLVCRRRWDRDRRKKAA